MHENYFRQLVHDSYSSLHGEPLILWISEATVYSNGPFDAIYILKMTQEHNSAAKRCFRELFFLCCCFLSADDSEISPVQYF